MVLHQSYLRENHPDKITTSDMLMKHLYDEYFDPNTREIAEDRFQDLVMTYNSSQKAPKDQI
ncbi:hypothetical protein F4806DRAFT_479700 [Annulohypoxylon nitens]|nr:hypothetical protein F4806DRAFT_479700 [Annulohypoxylon nitens]